MIFVFGASIIFPTICGACKFETSEDYADPDRDEIGMYCALFLLSRGPLDFFSKKRRSNVGLVHGGYIVGHWILCPHRTR